MRLSVGGPGLTLVEIDTNVWVNTDDVRAVEWDSGGGRPAPVILFKGGGRARAGKYSVRMDASMQEQRLVTDQLVSDLTGFRVQRGY